MKEPFLLVLLQGFCTAAFSQNLPFEIHSEIPIQRTNLIVRWKAPKHSLPKRLWVYRVAVTRFSPAVISNLMVLGSFTERDEKDFGTNVVTFSHPNAAQDLRISFTEGEIRYLNSPSFTSYGPANLTKGVPGTNQLFQVMTNFLPRLGISPSELARKQDSPKPKIALFVGETVFFENHTFTTNVPSRGIRFSRSVDGVELKGGGGHGEIDFGAQGQIIEIWVHWRKLERERLCPTATPETIIKWINEGKAVYWPRPGERGSEITVDWAAVKRMTVKNANVYYWGEVLKGERRQNPFPSWVRPYAELLATVDIGKTKTEVIIYCPIIDETKPAE